MSSVLCVLSHVVPHPPDHVDGLPGTTAWLEPGRVCGVRVWVRSTRQSLHYRMLFTTQVPALRCREVKCGVVQASICIGVDQFLGRLAPSASALLYSIWTLMRTCGRQACRSCMRQG